MRRNPNKVTLTVVPPVEGSSQVTINVDLNGKPWGQLWTFKEAPGETHGWHIKSLSGYYTTRWGDAFNTAKEQAISHVEFLTCGEVTNA